MTGQDDFAKRCCDIATAISFVEARLDNAPDPALVVQALRQLADDYERHVGTHPPRARLELGIGMDMIRWAGLIDAPFERMERFAEALEHSSVPEACGQIAEGLT